jgi:serine/threonine protein kinase
VEFLEGEALDSLTRRSGRLEVKIALQIVTQVAVRLGGTTLTELSSCDIKPANIMVNFEGTGSPVAKIVDLGLAKRSTGTSAEAAESSG